MTRSMSTVPALSFKKALAYFQVKETAVVLTVSVIAPFVIHLLPSYGGIPAGARFLPMFYAPFIAVVFFRPPVGLITSLLAPVLNSLILGLPVREKIILVTGELLFFTILSLILTGRRRISWAAAPLSYIFSAGFLKTVLVIFSSLPFGKKDTVSFVNPLSIALPGILVLFLLNIALCRWKEKTDGPA